MSQRFRPDEFEIGDQIGESAYCVVKRARYLSEERDVALRILDKKLIITENLTNVVFREKEILSILEHPNIARLLGTFKTANELCFVMELCDGGTLADYISSNGPLSLPVARFFVAEIVSALEYLLHAGVVHRDVTPANILLNSAKHIKLSDFSSAKVLGGDDDEPDEALPTRKGTFVGTAQFVAPEMLTSGTATPGTDLWALGVLLFNCLSGQYPFEAPSEYLMFQKIKERQMEFPEDFPDVARDLCDNLLRIDPSRRIGMRIDGFDELTSHDFFEGIDWVNLATSESPAIEPVEDPEPEEIEIPEEYVQFAPYLLKGESVVFAGSIIKRRHLSVKRRQLILTSRPRLIYIDPRKGVVKGTIPISRNLSCVKKARKKFAVKVPGRVYDLEAVDGQVDEWIQHILRSSFEVPE